MSVVQVQLYRPCDSGHFLAPGGVVDSTPARKRTTSFSSPPRKRLHRTDSYVDLSFAVTPSSASTSTVSTSTPTAVPYTRTLRYYKEQRERRRALLRREPAPAQDASQSCANLALTTPISATRRKSTPPPPPPPPPRARSAPLSPLALAASESVKCALTPPPPVRAPMPTRSRNSPSSSSSPSANSRTSSPPRPKPKSPDLHRRAITACMRASPAGAKILHMGARLAVGIMSATRELERMCAEDGDASSSSNNAEDGGALILDEDMDLGEQDAEGEDDDEDAEDDIDAESVDDEDMLDSDEDAPLQVKPLGRLIVPAPQPAVASDSLERVESEADGDVQMSDAPLSPVTLSASWIVVGPREKEKEDWEMVDGA